MRKNIQLRLDYIKLCQQDKPEEAFCKLKELWRFESGEQENVTETETIPQEVVEEVPKATAKKKTQVEKGREFNSFEDLRKITGIGAKTVKDLEKIYRKDFSKLALAIRLGDHIPVRDDIEELLIRHLK